MACGSPLRKFRYSSRCARKIQQPVGAVEEAVLRISGPCCFSCRPVIQGKFAQAEPLLKRCQTIKEAVLGPEHPRLAVPLYRLAGVLVALVRATYEADTSRTVHVAHGGFCSFTPGGVFDEMRTFRRRLLVFVASQGNHDEAGRLYERSLGMLEKALGPGHPDVAQALHDLAVLLWREQVKLVDVSSTLFRFSSTRRVEATGWIQNTSFFCPMPVVDAHQPGVDVGRSDEDREMLNEFWRGVMRINIRPTMRCYCRESIRLLP